MKRGRKISKISKKKINPKIELHYPADTESHPAGTPTFTSQTTAPSTTASFSVPLIGSGHQIAAQSYRQTRWKAQEKKEEE